MEAEINGKSGNTNWSDDKIHMNDSLTQFNRNLFFKARVVAREMGYKYVWFDPLSLKYFFFNICCFFYIVTKNNQFNKKLKQIFLIC